MLGSKGTAQTFMVSIRAPDTMLTVNACVLRTLAPGVLLAPVRPILDAERENRRIGRQTVEETERSGVYDTVPVHRRHPRDRAGHHCSDQELVAVAPGQRCEVKLRSSGSWSRGSSMTDLIGGSDVAPEGGRRPEKVCQAEACNESLGLGLRGVQDRFLVHQRCPAVLEDDARRRR